MNKLLRTLLFVVALGLLSLSLSAADRPNILWITCEDTSPNLGCYGDTFANTPNLDRFASRSLRYRTAWSCAPVCAPARTTIISGVYPPSTGSLHMRSQIPMPSFMKMYPQLLREAGYYCSNNAKEDYNLEKPGEVWNESSRNAHWKNRKPGQPFFAIFNFETTHESKIRSRPHTLVQDPGKVRVREYHPDTPEVRHDWTQYYDNIATMDGQFQKILSEMEAAGLKDETIVFFYGDHGSGMPRSKRFPYNSGLQVPFIVHIPEKFKHLAPKDYVPGGQTDRLISFVDLAPTLLSLAGVKPPEWMQGYAFMGRHEAAPQPYIYGFRGRMDERYDLMRSVRNERYVYIRNFMPHLPYGQHVNYMFQTPTTAVWKKMYDEGKLMPPKTHFWERKPPEELYDLQADPDETRNLAGSPQHQKILADMRKAQQDLALKIRDVGFLPEAEIHARAAGSTPYEIGHDDKKVPLQRIIATAELASKLNPETVPQLKQAHADKDSGVRYWGAMGLLMRGKPAVETSRAELQKAMSDESPSVRVVAAQALGQFGSEAELKAALPVLVGLADIQKNNYWVSVEALNAIDKLEKKAASMKDAIKSLTARKQGTPQRTAEYVPRLLERLNGELR
jgi:arylsulfatase A-like enzyme